MSGSNRPIAMTALALVFLVPSACTWSFGTPEPETTEMHQRFSRTVDIQTGVVLGDLGRAQRAAAWLATHEETEALTRDSETHPARIRGYASQISRASDLDSVAQQAGQMAGACGDCHTAMGKGPRFVVGSGAPQGNSRAAAMIRHLWAADRMWEGLVGPSEDAWEAGARALIGYRIAGAKLLAAASSLDAAEGHLARIRSLGQEAERVTTQEGRARVYTELLSTCRGCHESGKVLVEGQEPGGVFSGF